MKEISGSFCLFKGVGTQIEIVSNNKEWSGSLKSLQNAKKFEFKPHFGWKDHIEL